MNSAGVFQKAQIPYISSYAIHPDITRAGNYVFRTSFMGEVQGRAAAKFIGDLLKKKKVTLIGDPELTRARPEGQSIVQVTTRDGRRLEKRVTTFKGRSENPLTTDEVEEKARELLEPVLGQPRTRQLIDAIDKLETLASMRDLRPLLRA